MDQALNLFSRLTAAQEQRIIFSPRPDWVTPTVVPILLNGGVGDVVMAIPLVRELFRSYPIEVWARHATAFNYVKTPDTPEAKQVPIPFYSWFLEINAVARFNFKGGDLGLPGFARPLWNALSRALSVHPTLRTMTERHPHFDTALARWARANGYDRRSLPAMMLGQSLAPYRPGRLAPAEKYITIHDGYEIQSEHIVTGRATKCWKWEHWNALVRYLKAELPDYKILQLGAETARPIDGVDACLINQTTILEAFDILKESALHIDGDSGLVHAATAMGVPCVVMFGPTPDYFYGYEQNANLRADTCPDACYWLKDDWLGRCPIGYNAPKCMDDLVPERVMNAVRTKLQLEEMSISRSPA